LLLQTLELLLHERSRAAVPALSQKAHVPSAVVLHCPVHASPHDPVHAGTTCSSVTGKPDAQATTVFWKQAMATPPRHSETGIGETEHMAVLPAVTQYPPQDRVAHCRALLGKPRTYPSGTELQYRSSVLDAHSVWPS
jgi:hypothetical protein